MSTVRARNGKSIHRLKGDGAATRCGRVVTPQWSETEATEPTCLQCAREEPPRFCRPKGHDTWALGRLRSNGGCAECHRVYNRRRQRRIFGWENTRMNPESIPNLRAVRFNLGLTQRGLARFCRCSATTISRLEKGELRASERMRRQILAGVKRARQEGRDRIAARERAKLSRGVAA